MNNKLKFTVELNNYNEAEELVQLVTNQVGHLWAQWDKRSTPDQKILMETLRKNPNTLPEDILTYFDSESEMMVFMLRTKEYFWNYVNALERLKDLQKAIDRCNYNSYEPFEEAHYGLHWEMN
jgi:hypothetical protein